MAVSLRTRVKKSLLRLLKPNSTHLMDLPVDVRSIVDKYAICSFIEENLLKIYGRVVVERHSALMGLEHEDYLYISGDHSTMCNFDKDGQRFETVWRSIYRVAQGPKLVHAFQIRSMSITSPGNGRS